MSHHPSFSRWWGFLTVTHILKELSRAPYSKVLNEHLLLECCNLFFCQVHCYRWTEPSSPASNCSGTQSTCISHLHPTLLPQPPSPGLCVPVVAKVLLMVLLWNQPKGLQTFWWPSRNGCLWMRDFKDNEEYSFPQKHCPAVLRGKNTWCARV